MAKYLSLAIQGVKTGVASFAAIHETAGKIQAGAINPTDADRAAAEAEIAKLEQLLNSNPASRGGS